MKRTMLAVATAGSLLAATTFTPTQADAAWWIAPAIVAGVVGGVALGAATSEAYYDPRIPAASYPRGTVSVRPVTDCYITRERVGGHLRRVEVCP